MGEQTKADPSRITTLSQESILREACLSAGIPVDKPLEECSVSELRDLNGVLIAFAQGLCNLLLPNLAEVYDIDPHPMSSIIGLATVNIEELLYRLNRTSADSNFSSSHDVFKSKKSAEENEPSGDDAEEKKGESEPSSGDAEEKEETQPSNDDAEEKEGTQPSSGDAEEKEETQPSSGDAEEKEGEGQPSGGDAEKKEETQPSGDNKEKEEDKDHPTGEEGNTNRRTLIVDLALKILDAKKSGSSIDELLQGVDAAIAEEASRLAERLNRDRSTRSKTERSRGKQTGSKGHGFQTPTEFEEADVEIIVHEDCQNCPHKEKCLENATFSATHHRFEVEVVVKRYSARTATMVCPLSQDTTNKESENYADTTPVVCVGNSAEQPGSEDGSESDAPLAQPEDSESAMAADSTMQPGTEDGSESDAPLAQPEGSESTTAAAPAVQPGTEGDSAPDASLAQPEDSESTTTTASTMQPGTEGDSEPTSKPVANGDGTGEKPDDESSEGVVIKSGTFPDGFRGPNQYGNSIKGIAILLYVLATGSLGNIIKILRPFLHCPSLSTGVIWSWIQEMADKVQPTVEAIGRAALGESYVCVDETGGNVNGKTHWIHTVSTEIYTFMTLQESRGLKGMFDMGFLECYSGIAVHDFLKTYFGFLNFQDATCNEHIGRELKALIDHFKNCKVWATKMSDLLIEIKTAREALLEMDIHSFTEEVLKQYRDRYMAIIAEGKQLHPAPTKVPGRKGAPKKRQS